MASAMMARPAGEHTHRAPPPLEDRVLEAMGHPTCAFQSVTAILTDIRHNDILWGPSSWLFIRTRKIGRLCVCRPHAALRRAGW